MPGETIDEKTFAVFIGNERSLGGNFFPCPRAEVDDGKLDLCLVRAGTGASYFDLFRRIARGDHLALERTVVYRQTPGPLEIGLSKPSPFLADGDLWVTSNRFVLRMLRHRFEVITG
jgi:diacylglycerol kinase family enzyme